MTETRVVGRWGHVATWVAILFLLAAGLRVGWVLVRWGPEGRAEHLDYPDEDAYVLGARSLAAGHGLVDEFGYRATYMPGYPAFLAVFQGRARPLLWARVVQAILAAWVAPATFLLARGFVRARRSGAGDGKRAASTADTALAHGGAGGGAGGNGAGLVVPVLAGLAAALDPFLIFFSGLLLTEALFAAVLVTAWVFLIRGVEKWGDGSTGETGRAFGRWSRLETSCVPVFLWMAVMLRPAAGILVVLTPVVMVVLGRFRREVLVRAVAIPALVMVGLLPWAIRNYVVLGEWRWLSTRGGISLYDGLQPGATGESDLAHTKKTEENRGLTEVEWDHHFSAAAWDAARSDPGRVLRLAGRKFQRTWSLTPHVENYRGGRAAVVSALWMSGVFICAGIGWWLCRRWVAGWVLLLLPVAAFTLLHMVYVGSVRYRVPVMPFVMVLAVVGLGECGMRSAECGMKARGRSDEQ